MKKVLLLFGVLLAIHIALLFVRPRGAAEVAADSPVHAGVVFDVGGRGDKSFNDGAYDGADAREARARRDAFGSSSRAKAPIARRGCACSPPKGWTSSSASASSSPTT